MRALLLAVMFLSWLSAPALAQRAGAPAGTAGEETPALTALAAGCVRPGDMITIQGRRLDALRDHIPAIEQAGSAIPLEILSRNDSRFIVRLPPGGADPDKTYAVVLAETQRPQRFTRTGLRLRLCPATSAAVTATGPAATDKNAAAGEILILAAPAQRRVIRDDLARRGLAVRRDHELGALGAVLLVVDAGDAPGLIADLRTRFPDADIDANDDLAAVAGPPRLYARDMIKWPAAGDCRDNVPGLRIGLLDGAVETAHPALAGRNIIAGNFLSGAAPDTGHATALASILVGNGAVPGLDGLLPDAKLYNAIALRRAAKGRQLAATDSTLRGLDWLLGEKVRLINVSLATPQRNRVLAAAFDLALARGALIFAAAGNDGPQAPPVYPAALDGAFAITALDAAGRIYKNANRGDYIDFSAPGVDIWVADSVAGGAYRSGTSYAAPHALALAAQVMGENPNLPRDLLQKRLALTAVAPPAGDPRTPAAPLLPQAFCNRE